MSPYGIVRSSQKKLVLFENIICCRNLSSRYVHITFLYIHDTDLIYNIP
jgi:hypothetical protein